VDRMCSSIRELGFQDPVLARSDGTVVDGHLRLKAAKKLRITEVPVVLCDEWSEAQLRGVSLENCGLPPRRGPPAGAALKSSPKLISITKKMPERQYAQYAATRYRPNISRDALSATEESGFGRSSDIAK